MLDRSDLPTVSFVRMSDLREGVSLLLSDVAGSTQLWERWPKEMAAALARHDEIFRGIVSRNHGTLIKERGEGDSQFAVFAEALHAID